MIIWSSALFSLPWGDGGELMFGGERALAKHEGVYVDNDDEIDKTVAMYLRTKLEGFLDIEKDSRPLETAVESDAPVTDGLSGRGLAAEKEWTSLMGFSQDGFPWIGGIPDTPGLWLSAGFTGDVESTFSKLLVIDRL